MCALFATEASATVTIALAPLVAPHHLPPRTGTASMDQPPASFDAPQLGSAGDDPEAPSLPDADRRATARHESLTPASASSWEHQRSASHAPQQRDPTTRAWATITGKTLVLAVGLTSPNDDFQQHPVRPVAPEGPMDHGHDPDAQIKAAHHGRQTRGAPSKPRFRSSARKAMCCRTSPVTRS